MYSWLHIRNSLLYGGLLLALCWGVSNKGMAQTIPEQSPITLHLRKVPLTTILDSLEQASGFHFAYESSLVEGVGPCSLDATRQPLDQCLHQLFPSLRISYQIVGKTIILRRRQAQPVQQPVPVSLPIDTMLSARLDEVVVEAQNPRSPLYSTQLGLLTLTPQEVRKTPFLLGEPDLFKTLQLTPGVAMGTELLSSLYVRGGDADQNLYWLDGVPIYHTGHLGGIFATFNTDAVQLAGFYKGSLPARYGERLSSVIDARTMVGDSTSYHGSASIGLMAGKVHLSGPLVPGKSHFTLAYRRTWTEIFTEPAMAIVRAVGQGAFDTYFRYGFQDVNAKMDYRLPRNGKLEASFYYGDDLFKLREKPIEKSYNLYRNYHWRWGNLAPSLRWSQPWSERIYSEVQFYYTHFRSKVNNQWEMSSYTLPSARHQVSVLNDLGGRFTLDIRLSRSHQLKTGLDYVFHTNRPSLTYGVQTYRNQQHKGHEYVLFGEEHWRPTSQVALQLGLRLSHYRTSEKGYTSLSPRGSVRYQPLPHLSLKAAYTKTLQYVHLLSENYLNLPSDLWLPTSDQLPPMTAHQVTLGLYSDKWSGFIVSLEGYYKSMDQLVAYRPDYRLQSPATPLEQLITTGSGRSYGLEWMIKRQTGKLTGWVGYTLSWTDRHFAELNQGHRFPARFDNRHKLNIVASYALNDRIELTATWSLASGNRLTYPTEYYKNDMKPVQPGDKGSDPLQLVNSFYYSWSIKGNIGSYHNVQLPMYHRLDLGVQITRPLRNGRKGIWNFGLYNAYCHMNPIGLSTYFDRNQAGQWVMRLNTFSLLPTLPSVSYTYQF